MKNLISKYYCSFISIIATSFSVVYIESSVRSISPAFMLFVSVTLATLYFHLINISSIGLIYKGILADVKNFTIVSVVSAVVWIATFYSIKMVDSYTFLFVYFITAAMIACSVCIFNEGKNAGLKLIALIGLLGVLIYATVYSPINSRGSHYLMGILLAMLGGCGGYCYRKFSYILSHNVGLTASQALAVRSYGILLFSYFFIPSGSFSVVNVHYLPGALIVTLFSFILPLYFNQRGFLKAGPEMHSIISAASPLCCCIMRFLSFHVWSPALLIESLVVTVLLVLAVI